MKIMIAGSISDSAAPSRVCTSSSKNSATEPSIAGSAPVDSPTSIMSSASGGKTPVAFSDADSVCPSRTDFRVDSSALDNTRVPTLAAAVSSA